MLTTRHIALILVLAATAVTPAAALASNGADDNPLAPDHHGVVVTSPAAPAANANDKDANGNDANDNDANDNDANAKDANDNDANAKDANDNDANAKDNNGAANGNDAADDHPGANDRRGASSRSAAGNGRHGGRITATGTCTMSSSATLTVKRDNRRLETQFEVDQNRDGVTWTVEIDVNGKPVVAANATTDASSGSFSLERRLVNTIGSDSIVATATSPSGEVCSATVSV
jgi:hypothetical protein